MCSAVLSDYFRHAALLLATGCTVFAVLKLSQVAWWLLRSLTAGALCFALLVGGSVMAVNVCADTRLEAFDVNANGIFETAEMTEGFLMAEALAVGDGGRNMFALASPFLGVALAGLLVLLARRRVRGGSSDS